MIEGLCELLVAGVEFPDLGLVKIEPNHLVPSAHSLFTQLEERRPRDWDIFAYREQYIDEIWEVDYIHAVSLKSAALASMGPSRGVSTPLATGADRAYSRVNSSFTTVLGIGTACG